ncbi:hypothetical protein [Candidatus Entotheonella palauensis]|uniref:hypothetical protein n=1 Tax=Candidatus Entotheonella palauensis TaxID=93172 RepID=UPI001177963D|nr:hypothetical protein [Candidatus Entotheonella palauensis]
MDPYGDAVLDVNFQEHWLRALRNINQVKQIELRSYHAAHTRLPREQEARERILATLVKRDLEADVNFNTIEELEALIELALESGAVIRASGD